MNILENLFNTKTTYKLKEVIFNYEGTINKGWILQKEYQRFGVKFTKKIDSFVDKKEAIKELNNIQNSSK